MEQRLQKLYESILYKEGYDNSFTKKDRFYNELSLRNSFIDGLGLDIYAQILDKELTERYIHMLEGFRESTQSIFNAILSKEKTFLTVDTTMNQLLRIEHLLTKSQYNLVVTNKTMKSMQHIYNDIDKEQHFYYEIWDDLYDYFINSEKCFNKWRELQYCNEDIINKKSYIADLDEIILDIFSSVQNVIEYLTESKKFNKYKDRLMQYFIDTDPKTVFYNKKFISMHKSVYPNKVIYFQIDLNDSLMDQTKNLELLYKDYHNNISTDYKFMFEHKVTLTNHQSNKYRGDMYHMFFAFDAFLLGASINDITTILHINNNNNRVINVKTVRKHINRVKTLLLNQTFKKDLSGREIIISKDPQGSCSVADKNQTIARIY